MKVWERYPGKWYVRFQHKGKQVWRYTGRTQKEAMEVSRDFRRRIQLEGLNLPNIPKSKPEPEPITFRQLAAEYLVHSHSNKAHTTYNAERKAINAAWRPCFRDRPIREITPALILAWRNTQSERISQRTIRGYLQVLKTMWVYAERLGYVTGPDPVGKLPKAYKSEITIYSADQIRQYLAACGPHCFPIAATLILTGMRPVELRNLERRDVDLVRGIITIRPTSSLKNVRGRTVPINSQLAPILEAQLASHRSAFVFPGASGGKRTADLRKGHYYALRKSGLPRIRMYDLRHMFASLLLAEGRDPAAVADLMGHGGLEITMRIYHHLNPERARRVIKSMPEIVTGSQTVANQRSNELKIA